MQHSADGLGDAHISATQHLAENVADLGVTDSSVPTLLHRENKLPMLLSVAAIAMRNMEASFADKACDSEGPSPSCMATLS